MPAIAFAVFCSEYLIVLFFVLLLAYLFSRHRTSSEVWGNILLSMAIGVAAAYLIRKGWYHPRPFALSLGTNFLPHEWTSSFPSKHVTAIATPAFSLCLMPATWRFACFAVANTLLVAWSRIYLGVHWPQDILAALLIGFAAAWVANMAVNRLMAKR